jgi:hypothetical protein
MNNQYKFSSAFVIIENEDYKLIEDYPCKSKSRVMSLLDK